MHSPFKHPKLSNLYKLFVFEAVFGFSYPYNWLNDLFLVSYSDSDWKQLKRFNWIRITADFGGTIYPDSIRIQIVFRLKAVWPRSIFDPDPNYFQAENSLKTFDNSLKPVMHANSGKNCRFENNYGFENSYKNSYRLKSVMNPDNCKFWRSVIRIQFENIYGLKTVTRIENSYLSVIESG